MTNDAHPIQERTDNPVLTDGAGQFFVDDEWFVVDEGQNIVVDGPYSDRDAAVVEAANRGPDHIVVAERVLEQRDADPDTPLRWQTGDRDVDVVTDGGVDHYAGAGDGQCLALKSGDGERCTNGVYGSSLTCGVHRETSKFTLAPTQDDRDWFRCNECGWQPADYERGGGGPPYCSECGIEFPAEAPGEFDEFRDDVDLVTDGGVAGFDADAAVDAWTTAGELDLTRFQHDLLAALASGAGSGQELKAQLETERDIGEINHGRLYPNLDTLVEEGLVAKSARNRRANEYRITPAGADVLHERLEWVATQCDLRLVDADHRLAAAGPATQEGGR